MGPLRCWIRRQGRIAEIGGTDRRWPKAQSRVLPAALAFFHRALAAAASLARQAALRLRLRPFGRPGPRVVTDSFRRPRRPAPLLPGTSTLRSSDSSDSSLLRRCLITTARRSCFTDRSTSEFIAVRIPCGEKNLNVVDYRHFPCAHFLCIVSLRDDVMHDLRRLVEFLQH